MAKKAKSKPEETGSGTTGNLGPVDVSNMQFWREVARQIVPNEDDDWHIGEVATTLRLLGDCLGKEWAQASKICNKSEGALLGLGISVSINRKETPPSVKVSLGYAEKHKRSAESDVADPSQTELPGISEPSSRAEMTVETEPELAEASAA
jgi:hypothetical protein